MKILDLQNGHSAVYCFSNPVNVVGHEGVDTKFALFSATLTETGDSENRPSVLDAAQQRSARVASAGISSAGVTGAEHVFAYVITLVHLPALFIGHHEHLKKLFYRNLFKIVSIIASVWCRTWVPSRSEAFLLPQPMMVQSWLRGGCCPG